MKHGISIVAATAALLLAGTTSSAAAVTIGQLPTTVPGGTCISSPFDTVEPNVSSGNSYAVPNTGGVTQWTLTSWSHFARAAAAGQKLTMKVFRKVGEPNTYQVVGHDGPRDLTPGVINTFAVNVAVKAGDILGNNDVNASDVGNACVFEVPGGDSYRQRRGDLADGESGDFDISGYPGLRVNVSAEVAPTNTFTLGALTRNKKKGTAIETATVPNPGSVRVAGKGVRRAGASGARTAVDVPAAGTVRVLIRAKGKKKRKLDSTGKVKVKAVITYTPRGGAPRTERLKVKLKKKL